MWNFLEVFLIILSLFANLKLSSAFAVIYMFLSYEIFDQQLKITFRKSLALIKKSTFPPFLLTRPLKTQKVQVPPYAKIEIFSGTPPCRKGRMWRTLRFIW